MEVELVLDNTKDGNEGAGDASGTGCGGWGAIKPSREHYRDSRCRSDTADDG